MPEMIEDEILIKMVNLIKRMSKMFVRGDNEPLAVLHDHWRTFDTANWDPVFLAAFRKCHAISGVVGMDRYHINMVYDAFLAFDNIKDVLNVENMDAIQIDLSQRPYHSANFLYGYGASSDERSSRIQMAYENRENDATCLTFYMERAYLLEQYRVAETLYYFLHGVAESQMPEEPDPYAGGHEDDSDIYDPEPGTTTTF